jgi:hypothetical protein
MQRFCNDTLTGLAAKPGVTPLTGALNLTASKMAAVIIAPSPRLRGDGKKDVLQSPAG